MKIAYIVDSTASLSDELAGRSDVFQVHLSVTFKDGSVFKDTTDDAQLKSFYQRLATEKDIPKSSQPQVGEYYEVVEDIISRGFDTIIALHIGKGISGTYQSADMVLNEYKEDGKIDYSLIDTNGTSFIIEHLLEQTIEQIEKGVPVPDTVSRIEKLVEDTQIYLVVDDLNYLVKGGRLGAGSAFIGSLFKIKPVVYFADDGNVKPFDKVRTNSRVIKLWEKLIEEAMDKFNGKIKIAIAHGDIAEEAYQIKKRFENMYPGISCRVGYLTPALGVHGGPGSKGLGILPYI
ncbi:DegV domain-containing protein [Jeotgalicoccus saudimassiliensis]|uniref:DegV domain-containing protein n=1 Tax=Jeotgalicoccus saudimassiliensis TaxID=1461582 RepID=A0A078M879_9STAP|nr:DegV family protein [Jeotgalicoccus saudimassiliensis]CEA01592.1 DegV domain-containing protein [Jeotgalicoccus saudimassiliensis]